MKVMGVGFSWALVYELRRSRLHDKLRLLLLSWVRPSITSIGDSAPKPGECFSLLEHAKKIKPDPENAENECGDSTAVTTIISTDISLTSSLWVSTICLPPKHELIMQRASGMEIFYVLQGTGEWGSQAIHNVKSESESESSTNNSTDTRTPIQQGDALILEPNSSRWFANASATGNLILLRSSDAGHLHRKHDYDRVVPSSSRATVMTAAAGHVSAALSSTIQQMGGYTASFWGSYGSSTNGVES